MSYQYRSRTQARIEKISTEALKVREKGITEIRGAIEHGSNFNDEGSRSKTRQLIAALNYSVSQVQRELRNRRKK